MHSRILTFHELKLPHLDGDREGEWCTFSERDGMVYLLNAQRHELAALSEISLAKDIHFETEEECHTAACMYYHNYNKSYPHLKEWKASMPAPGDDVVVFSQVMEFI